MDCGPIRDLLTEYALGTLDSDARAEVDRHLAWCAGCRREARELAEGVAAVGLGLPGPEPPPELERRVLAAVAAGPRRWSRSVLVAAVAAVVAVASTAWAITVTTEEAPVPQDASLAGAVDSFEGILEQLSGGRVRGAELRTTAGGVGGRALVYDGQEDWVLVVATGIPPDAGPYRAYLTADGGQLEVGRMVTHRPGERAVIRIFPAEVSAFRGVLVTDSRGVPILRGTLEPEA